MKSPPPRPHPGLTAAIAIAGSQGKLAKTVGCTRPNISALLKAGKPLSAQYVLRAEAELGISRHVLNPEIYPREE